ncbi:cytochrome P450, partial [Stipitochalara longipes BDJ]
MEILAITDKFGQSIIYAVFCACTCLFFGNIVYNLWFHPLAGFPGPKWNAFSNLPVSYAFLRGTYPFYLNSVHEHYGDVVRIRPDALSFSDSQAAKDILTNKTGRGQLQKDPNFYTKHPNGFHSILTVPSDTDHSRYRRLLSHGFSEKAIREQESVVKIYVDLLIQRLHKRAKEGPQDMVAWFNWTTFDLIGDLTFDRSFDCLENEAYHEWIPFVFGGIKAVLILGELRRYPLVMRLLLWLFRKQLISSREKGAQFTKERVDHRISSATDRLDFLGHIFRHDGKETEMSRGEIDATSAILVLGGSDTTATLLSGTVYYLLQNPRVMQKLVAEIRESFINEDQINMTSVNSLSYLLAILEEAMRIYPPVTLGSPRIVGEEGTVIGAYQVPPKTAVVDSQYAASHSSRNFRNPKSFVPERWLDDPAFENDDKAASHPFSLGPRNCIGRNLAYAEMRVILARLVWNFDMENAVGTRNWIERNRVYSLWEKPPLPVLLKPVAR